MTKREVSKLQKVLEASAVELDDSARRRDAILIDGAGDLLDQAVGAAERELAARNLNTVYINRRQAKAALQRIREGAYGICVDCEEAISPKRLAAVPWALRCIRCQQAADCGCGAPSVHPSFPMAA